MVDQWAMFNPSRWIFPPRLGSFPARRSTEKWTKRCPWSKRSRLAKGRSLYGGWVAGVSRIFWTPPNLFYFMTRTFRTFRTFREVTHCWFLTQSSTAADLCTPCALGVHDVWGKHHVAFSCTNLNRGVGEYEDLRFRGIFNLATGSGPKEYEDLRFRGARWKQKMPREEAKPCKKDQKWW